MEQKQVVNGGKTVAVFNESICKQVADAMGAETKARKQWSTLATSLHDAGVLVSHLVQPTEAKPNDSFNLSFFTGLRSIIVKNLDKGYRDVMLNSDGEMTAKAAVPEGFPRKTWESGNKEVKGFFNKIREHLRKAEAEENDSEQSTARMLKKLVNDTLVELSVQIGKMPEKRRDCSPFDAQTLLEVCRKGIAGLK
jgi:hypothetical protein